MRKRKTNDLPLYNLAIRAVCTLALAGAMATGAILSACRVVQFVDRTFNG